MLSHTKIDLNLAEIIEVKVATSNYCFASV